MKIYIIGINSFIGSSLASYLVKNNLKKNIYGCSRQKLNSKILKKFKNNIIFHKFDLNHDVKKLIKKLEIIKPHTIINFAAQSIVEESWKFPKDWFNTNLISNIELLEYLKNTKYLKKYIYSSTPEVYGSTKKKISENFNYFPNTPYATSKAAIDMLLKNYYDQYNFPVIWTRIANIYGPGQQTFKIIPKSILSIKKKVKIPLHGGGASKRCFIYSDDVSEALFKIHKKGKIGNIYHISNNKQITIKQLVKTISRLMNKNFNQISKISKKDRPGKDLVYYMSSRKLKSSLKWKSKFNLQDGIKQTINWIDKNYYYLNKSKLKYEHKK